MRRRVVLTAVMGLLMAACSQPAPAPAPGPDLAAEEQAIRDLDARWLKAEQARDPAGSAAMLADDAVVYREHVDPLVGPAAFESFMTTLYTDNPNVNVTWTTDDIQVAESGDLAVQTGQYHLTAVGPKGDGEDRGRFLTVWKKVNGGWKVAYDMGSTTMPAMAAEATP